MNLQDVFVNIKNTFCDLWKIKERGDTIEVVTPYTTQNSKFISVFITLREESFVVTDGGWLTGGEYSDTEILEDNTFKEIIKYFEAYYELKTVNHYGTILFYKTTKNKDMLPNQVHDLAQFISQCVASYESLNYETPQEVKEADSFRHEVDRYLIGIVGKKKFRTSQKLGDGYEGVRFNAQIIYGNSVTLIKYVTGSTFDNYRKSVSSASMDFEIARNSPYDQYISKKISIVNDSAGGFDQAKIAHHLRLLERHMDNPVNYWSQRDRLSAIL